MKKNIFYILLVFLTFGLNSCSDDFLKESPESYISTEQLKTSPTANLGILRGIYASLRSYKIANYGGHEDYGHKSMLSIADLMGNDVVMRSLNWNGFYYNFTGRLTTSSRSHMPWFTYYIQIKNANIVINNVNPNVATDELKQIRAQALALRGYFHFMLARFYAPTYINNENSKSIPINTGKVSKIRNTNKEVYDQIVKDLKEAITGLKGYKRENKEFIDQGVAKAFLADVYLEIGKFAEAAIMANESRLSYKLLSKESWKNGFYDINQNETMWGADLNSELTTFVASFFSHFDNTNSGYAQGGIAIDKRLYDSMSDTDYRKSVFMGSKKGKYDGKTYKAYTSFKFRDLTSDRTQGDYIYLRSSLLYYIEAEALVRSGNEAKAQQVLFEITSNRDSNYAKSTKTGNDLIEEIILQKRIELWGEGFAFFDLKRLRKGIIRNYPGSNHGDFGKFNFPAGSPEFLIQIPEDEIDVTRMTNNP